MSVRRHFFSVCVAVVSAVFSADVHRAGAETSARPAPERAAAVSGGDYTVLGRTFLGESGNLSYLRFLNLSGSSATIKATLIGSPSGRTYGTADVVVADNASRQLSITEVMAAGGMSALASPDDRLAVYLQSASEPVAIQHVLYSEATGFFENLSSCQNSSVSDSNTALINVHTTRLTNFPSTIVAHNYGNAQVSYDIDVYKAETGERIGRVPITIAANATFEKPFSYFEQQLGYTPDSTVNHANLVAFPQSGGGSVAFQHLVFNARVTGYENLTNFCTISSALNGRPLAKDDNIAAPQSGTTASNITIAFATLIANDSNASNASLLDFTQPRANGASAGTLTRSGNDLVLAPSGSNGLITFEYRLRNSVGDSSAATVTVNTTPLTNTGTRGTVYTLTVANVSQSSSSTTGSGAGTVTSSTGGISCGQSCTADVASGTSVTLTAAPASGSRFIGWSGACSGSSATCTVSMTAAKSVTATFGLAQFTLTVVKAGSGLGTATSSVQPGINCGSVCSFSYDVGTRVSVTPGATGGPSSFRGWSGCDSVGGGSGTVCDVTMTSDRTVTATY